MFVIEKPCGIWVQCFHRLLSGERGLKKISLLLNESPLEPFDPFHTSHPATIQGPVERIKISGQEVVVQTFTLPHHRKVSPAEWERYAGRAGYLKNQGFYLYREKRLIIPLFTILSPQNACIICRNMLLYNK